jgi:hypothetical protein
MNLNKLPMNAVLAALLFLLLAPSVSALGSALAYMLQQFLLKGIS